MATSVLLKEPQRAPSAEGKLLQAVRQAYQQGRRLAAPLAGFPACSWMGVSIKVAQQNYGIHYKCIAAMVEKLRPDAAFMMMDLSVEANALGLPVRFPVHDSSSVEYHPVQTLEDLCPFRPINILQDSRICSYIKTVEMLRTGLPEGVLVGAYVIGPFTLSGLLAGAEQIAADTILDPEKVETLCQFSTGVIQPYARALVHAGADLLCILEPTAGIIGPAEFERFSAAYVRQIIDSVRHTGADTIYHICGNSMHLIEAMARSGVSALSLDSPQIGVNLPLAAQKAGPDVLVIGNINPVAVMQDGTPEQVRTACLELLEQMQDYPNFILSTGCDLPPAVPVENLRAFMETARRWRQNLSKNRK
ncbi:MAG TPA: uroporphyrinogen decarboxylase family protein [Anaerohalosphaeraceae bacterium]|nr:uroporphyrinogen decarboxylase family protein [Anaerohalosphaeraceae bacterium]